jgi:hypothetical protein
MRVVLFIVYTPDPTSRHPSSVVKGLGSRLEPKDHTLLRTDGSYSDIGL